MRLEICVTARPLNRSVAFASRKVKDQWLFK
jgi:hypothetical protein